MTISNIHRINEALGQQQQAPELPETVPDHLKCWIAADQLRGGVSKTDGDVGYPLITVLHSKSKVLNGRHPHYIAGATPGDFILRSPRPDPIRCGERGIDVIACYHDEVFKEWTSCQSKVLAVHLQLPADHHIDPKTGLLGRNGNTLIMTYRLFLLYEDQPFELSLRSGDEMNFFRGLTQHFSSYIDEYGRGMRSYVRRYRFATVRDPKRLWFSLTFTDQDWVSGAEYDAARQLSERLDAKLKQRPKMLQARAVSPE
jgi:hypothetical protein